MDAFLSQLLADNEKMEIEVVQDNAATHSAAPSRDRWSSIPRSTRRDANICAATRVPKLQYLPCATSRFVTSAATSMRGTDRPRLPMRTSDCDQATAA